MNEQTTPMVRLSMSPDETDLRVSVALHDINNLLAVISANIELLGSESLPPSAHDRLATTRKAIESAAALAHGVLRPASHADDQSTDVVQVLSDCLRFIKMRFAPWVRITSTFHCQPATVPVEAAKLRLVLLNLVINAANACDKPVCNISIALRSQKSTDVVGQILVLLEVEDDGPGIPEDIVDQLFEPFVSGDSKGTGLGLTSVRHTVSELGGQIEVSTIPTQGTRFSITFPATPPQ